MRKRILSVLLCAAMLLSMTLGAMPIRAEAVSNGAEQKPAEEQQNLPENNEPASGETANGDRKFFVEQIATIYQQQGSYAAQGQHTVYTASSQDQEALESAADALRQAMNARETDITVELMLTECDPSAAWYQVWDMAMEHTGEAKEGDYIAWQWDQCGGGISGETTAEGTHLVLQYIVSYYTDATQEAALDAAVDALLAELALWDATDYEKIYGIYDYMCRNIAYDFDNLYDETYILKFSAYAALVNKTAVCQGYALLFYRLALTLGVDARVITGIGNGGGHAWNIVELDNQYYNLDATWDRSWYEVGMPYAWFLLCNDSFEDHQAEETYLTAEFLAEYPMSQTDYVPAGEQEPENYIASGTCGDNLTWALSENGTLTISGTGEMFDYSEADDVPWDDYRYSMNAIVVHDGVTSIGTWAFFDCDGITSLVIPNSVDTIGSSAISCCGNLADLTIGSGVTNIGSHAFYDCSSLTSVTIPDSVLTIGHDAFSWCVNLVSVTIGNNVTTIGASAFHYCTALTSVVIPNSVTDMGEGVFYSCSSLASVTIGRNISSIGANMFYECAKLASIDIPDNIISIGDYAFMYCGNLTGVTIGDGVTSIGDSAFYECAKLASIVIPDNVISIGESAFWCCRSLISVTIGNGVTSIGNNAFGCCEKLISVTIPDSVTSVGDAAFYYCVSLTNATIGNGLSAISEGMFSSCNSLTDVTMGDNVTSIGSSAFERCYALTGIELPNGLTSIGSYAFAGCSQLPDMTIPSTVVTIGGYAFQCCSGLTVLIIPDSVVSIGTEAFGWCSNLTTVTIGSGVTTIGEYAFAYCTSLTEVLFMGDAPSIGDYAFDDVHVTAYYPANGNGWTSSVMKNYGGSITWVSYDTIICYKGHTSDSVVTDPTCAEQGYTTYTCSVCGYVYTDDYVDELGHDWDEGIVTVEPTEETEGQRLYTCQRCGETKTESIPMLEHTHSYEATVTNPTCTEGGYTTYTCRCGDSYVSDYTAALGHDYDAVVTAPTCTEDGYTTYSCSGCGDSYVGNYTAALEHNWDEGVVTVEPTEETEGQRLYTCQRCGETKTESIPMLEHTHSYEATVTNPTCTEGGYTTYTCRCGDSYIANYTDALGHDYDVVVTAPTCTEDGYTTYSCSGCGDSYVGNYTAALEHNWDEGVVTVEPTEETEGQRLYTCQRCGETKTESIPMLEHTHSYEATVTNPTCTEDGYTTYTCRCGDSYVSDYTAALGHDYDAVVTEPTCTEDGYTTYICSGCGDSYVADYMYANGHSPWELVAMPTFEACGEAVRNCAGCGLYETKVLPQKQTYAPFADMTGILQETLDGLDGFFRLDIYYMTTVVNGYFLEGLDYWDQISIPVDWYISVLEMYFAVDESHIEALWEWLDYDEEQQAFILRNGGGLGGMAPRQFVGYTEDGDTYQAYYATINYAWLSDALPEGMDEYEYAASLGWPEMIVYDGVEYYAGPDGYYNILGIADYGKKYTVELNGDVVRILSCEAYTAEDLPEHLHYQQKVTAEPTCTEQGYIAYVCDCGDQKVEEYTEATGHSYVDGVCEHCGEADPDAVVVMMGDANGDGVVNYLDAMLIAQYYVGDIGVEDLNLEAADVNGDGVVNYLDAMMVAQYYVGDIDKFPTEN